MPDYFRRGATGRPNTDTDVVFSWISATTLEDPVPVPLTLSVAPAHIDQDGAPIDTLSFTVTLSAAAAIPVSETYVLRDGTAHAGADYDGVSGTLTFAPGQTTQTIAVPVHPGAPGTLYFLLQLTGAAPAQTVAGLIYNPFRTVAAPDVTVHVATYQPPPTLLAPGWLHTSGNQIVDANGHPVRLDAVNWAGLESVHFTPDGLWAQNYKTILDSIVQSGFNTVRIPFSDQAGDPASEPVGIDYNFNPELRGLNPVGVLDAIVAYSGKIGLRIILDHHAASAGNTGNPLWYDANYAPERVLADWQALARRYADNPAVIGADLDNEPHGQATWGDGGPNDFAQAATIAGDAIQAINPHWLIVVEGVQAYNNLWSWWGGNLRGVADHPIQLRVPNQVVYSPHDYPASISDNFPFSDAAYPNNLPAFWDANWGYIYKQNIAPVWIGEYGSDFNTTIDQQWLTEFANYRAGNLAGSGGLAVAPGAQGVSGAYWSFNGDATQTAGILGTDWITVNSAILQALQPSLGATAVPPAGLAPPGQDVAFQVKLAQPSAAPVTVHYATRDITAHAGADYTALSGDLTFAPGDTAQIVIAHLLQPGSHAGQSLQFALDTTVTAGPAQTGPSAVATIQYDPPVAPATQTPTPGGVFVHIDSVAGQTVAATVTLTNAAAVPYTEWEVRLTTADVITGVTGGVVYETFGDNTDIAFVDANATIPAHGSLTFGIQATDPTGGSPIGATIVKFGN